jgi:hypothetical protein
LAARDVIHIRLAAFCWLKSEARCVHDLVVKANAGQRFDLVRRRFLDNHALGKRVTDFFCRLLDQATGIGGDQVRRSQRGQAKRRQRFVGALFVVRADGKLDRGVLLPQFGDLTEIRSL